MVEFGGGLSSLLTNYDVTFWLWMATALEEHGGRRLPPELKACTAVPFRKVWVHPLQPNVRRAMAAINLALVSSKIEDNRRDGEGRVLSFAFRPLQKPARKALSALDELGFPSHRIQELASRQSAVEADPAASLEDFAFPTSELMGQLFAFLGPLTEQTQFIPQLTRVGRSLGRTIYLLDALTDVEKDRKRGAFNALTRSFGYPISYAPTSRLLHDAIGKLEAALRDLPLGQTAALAEGMVNHLRSLLHEHLEFWKPRKVKATVPWGSWRHLPKAGFFVRPADDCDCGGCDGCGDGCSGCGDGCSGCGDGCSGCDCAKCDVCSGCGEGASCGGCSNACDTAICCWDTENCCCDGCCDCGETGRGKQRRNDCICCCTAPSAKAVKYNKPAPNDPQKGEDLLKPSGDLSEGIPRPVLDDDTWDPTVHGPKKS